MATTPQADPEGTRTGRGGQRSQSAAAALCAALLAASQPPEEDAETNQSAPINAILREWYHAERGRTPPRKLVHQLAVVVTQLDKLIARQLQAIIHHPRFQALESAWRGLELLWRHMRELLEMADREGRSVPLKLKALHISKDELYADFFSAIEFDQSALWQRIYEFEFGVAGGEPFGALLGDFEFRSTPRDLTILEGMAQIATASFAVFVAGADPKLLQPHLEHFGDLRPHETFPELQRSPDYGPWRSFREHPNSRFVGLALPRVLLRRPYHICSAGGMLFREAATHPSGREYLWGNANVAFGLVLMDAFAQCGWFADIRGAVRGERGGGLVLGLPRVWHQTDRPGLVPLPPVERVFHPDQEAKLSQLGFLPLCVNSGTGLPVFHTNPSVHKPEVFDDDNKSTSSRMSAMLQYALCVSRFSHYLKALGRKWAGTSESAAQVEKRLRTWVTQYVSDDSTSAELKAERPLREAKVSVTEEPDQPGAYRLVFHLVPHYQLDDLSASVRLHADLSGGEEVAGT